MKIPLAALAAAAITMMAGHRRLHRFLHVFQLEGYKRARFLEWSRSHMDLRSRSTGPEKKPLVMTGRARRIEGVTLVLSGAPAAAGLLGGHALAGAPGAVAGGALGSLGGYAATPWLLVVADVLLSPIQSSINARYLVAARRKLEDISPLVVGVTGSFGKTSTKAAVQGLLGPEALATPGSFNTPLGVCRSINENLEPSHRYFIVEMGAYREGDVAELCRFVQPSIGVLTAIGPAHLERFGSLDAIRRAKYEIVTGLRAGGTAVMNVDDPEVRALADQTTGVRVIRYGIDAAGGPDVTASDVEVSSSGTNFTIVGAEVDPVAVRTRLLGRHAVGHVLAAAAVAAAAGVGTEEWASRAGLLEPVEHRLALIEGTGGVTVIDDAYNSNPEGAAAAFEVLAAMPGKRKVIVTPGIIEFGPVQAEANRRLGQLAAQTADVLIVVAKLNREAILAGASSSADGQAPRAEVMTVDSLDEATAKLATLLAPGDVVLFENDLPDQLEA